MIPIIAFDEAIINIILSLASKAINLGYVGSKDLETLIFLLPIYMHIVCRQFCKCAPRGIICFADLNSIPHFVEVSKQ